MKLQHGIPQTKQCGATLIETILATSIVGVLTTAAAPAMQDLVSQQHLRSINSELLASLHLARSEAIKRGTAVALIPADTKDWSTGWRVFVDENDNGKVESDEATLAERVPGGGGVSIKPYFGATYSGLVLSYAPSGRLHRPGGVGLVIGRLVLNREGRSRSVCFASLGFRPTTGAICD